MNKIILSLVFYVMLTVQAHGVVLNNIYERSLNISEKDVTITNSFLLDSTDIQSTKPSKLVVDQTSFITTNNYVTLIKGYSVDIKNSTFHNVLFGRIDGVFNNTAIFGGKLGEKSDVRFNNSNVNTMEFFDRTNVFSTNTTFTDTTIAAGSRLYIESNRELHHGNLEVYSGFFTIDTKQNATIGDIESEKSTLKFFSASDATITVGNIYGFENRIQIGDYYNPMTNLVVESITDTNGVFLEMYSGLRENQISSLTVNNASNSSNQFIINMNNNASTQYRSSANKNILTLNNYTRYPYVTLSGSIEIGGYRQALYSTSNGRGTISYYLANRTQLRSLMDSLDDGTELSLVEGQDPNEPILTTTADASGNVILTSYLTNFSEIQSISDRLQSVNEGSIGSWGRIYNGKFNSIGNGLLSGINLKYTGIQLGVDKQVELTSQSNLIHGFGLTYTNSNASYDNGGNGSAKSYSIAYYLSYFNSDFYNDTILKYARMVNKFQVTDTAGLSVTGRGDMNVYTFSNEVGKKIYFNTDKNGLNLNPFGQVILSKFSNSTIDASNGLNTKINSRQSIVGKVGSYFGYNFDQSKVYAKVAYGKEFNKDNEFTLNGSSETYQMEGGFMEYQLGTTLNLTDHQKLDITASYLDGDNFNQKQISAAYRIMF